MPPVAGGVHRSRTGHAPEAIAMQQSSKKTPAFTFAALLVASGMVPMVALAPTAEGQFPCPTATGSPANPLRLLQLEWNDLDHNGHLDAVRATASFNLDKATISPNDFLIPAADNATRRAKGLDGAGAGVNDFWLFFEESSVLDGGWATPAAAPTLTFSPVDGVIRIRAANTGPCPTASTVVPTAVQFTNAAARVSIDRAAPTLLAGYATAGATSLLAVFSEPVSRDGGNTACTTPPAPPFASCFPGSGIRPASDFCFVDATGMPAPIYGVTPVGTYPAQAFTVTLSKTVASATTTASSNTVTTSGTGPATFMPSDVGRSITGTGIPAGTTIAAVNTANSITISQLATASSSAVTLTIFTPITTADVAVQNFASGSGTVAHLYAGHYCVMDATAAPAATSLFSSFSQFDPSDVGRTVSGPGIAVGTTITVFNSQSSVDISTPTSGLVRGVLMSGPLPHIFCCPNYRDRAQDPDGTGPLGAMMNNGLPPQRPLLPPGAVAVGGPYPVSVHASVGDTRVVLDFSGPVANSAGLAITGGFSVAGGAPSWTIGSTVHTLPASSLGSNRVTLNAQTPLTTLTDGVVILANAVKGAGHAATSPGAITWPLADSPYLSSPRVLHIDTVDGSGGPPDGCLDAVKVTFNEPVTGGATGAWTVFWAPNGPTQALTYATGDGSKTLLFTHPAPPTCSTAPTSTPWVSATLPALPTPTTIDAASNPLVFGRATMRTVSDATATFPSSTLSAGPGGFRYEDIGALVSGTGIAPGTRITSVNSLGTSATIMPAITASVGPPGVTTLLAPVMNREPTIDGASPMVLSATTADCQVRQPTGPPLLTTTGCSPNGKIDAIVLAWSEPLATFRHASWLVRGDIAQPVPCLTTGAATSATTPSWTVNGNASLGPALKILKLTETSGTTTFDTACVPDVTYTGTVLKDAAGNTVQPILAAAALESDGAGPVLVEIQGTVGSTYAQAIFSERPCGWRGVGCPALQPSDFVYRLTTGGSATALSSVAPNPTATNRLDLSLPSAVTSADLQNRCLEPVAPLTPGTAGSGSTNGVSDAAFNLPFPRQGQTPSCRAWLNTAAPRVVSADTVDSNRDGFLDAVKLTLNQPIVTGNRLLRHAGATTPSGTDTVYFDAGATPSGTVDVGDFRFTAFGTGASCPANCPAGTTVAGGDADIGTSIASTRILWADLGIIGTPELGDALYADVDTSLSVTQGDFRYTTLPSAAIGTVACAATRDADCGRPLPASGYTDTVRDGFVGDGDARGAVAASLPPGAVNCSGGSPDAECGRALTPANTNLDIARFGIAFTPANSGGTVTCITTGKAAGPLFGSTADCTGGVGGIANPPAGFKPGPVDSCAGALQGSINNSVLFVCFTHWNTLGVPIPNTGETPKVSYTPAVTTPVGGTIRSSTGLPLGPFNGAGALTTTDKAAPVLVEALAGAGDLTVNLRASEPIGKGTGGTEALGPLDFGYVNGNAGSNNCRGGADTIQSVTSPNATSGNGVFVIAIKLSRALTHDDVVGCIENAPPSSSTPARDGIQLVGTGIVEHGGGLALVTPPSPSPPIPATFYFRDMTLPAIAKTQFIDASGNGVIDVVRVTFTEPVNDCFGAIVPAAVPPAYPGHSAFCTGIGGGAADPTGHYGWPARIGDFTVKIGTVTLPVLDIVTGQDGVTGEPCRDTYPSGTILTLYPDDIAPTFGPAADRSFNDDTIFLCLDPDNVLANLSAPGVRDQGTGVTGTIVYTAPAGTTCATRICDLADTGPDMVSTMAAPNLMATAASRTVTDAARPVIMTAETADRNHNGKVDAVKVTFSELVNPTTFTLADWSLEGKTITGLDVDGNNVGACNTTSTVSTGKPSIWLCFAEVAGDSTFDTDIGRTSPGPRLTYVGAGSLRDKATTANPARAFSALVTDGAQPAVVKVQATIGSATVTITFSEGVDGTGGPTSLSITYSDLFYQNGAGTGSQASGFGVSQVVHSPGDRPAGLTLNQPVSQADLDTDKICFVPGTVKEHAPPSTRLLLYNSCVPLNGILDDTTPPSAVTDLTFNRTGSTATTVRLDWTAPNGTADADLATYEIRVCTCAITSTNVLTSAVAVTAGLPTPVLGTHQSFSYTPAAGWTSLNFTLLTRDSSGNWAQSNVVRATPPDNLAPGVIATLTAVETSANGDQVQLSWTAPPQDSGAPSSGKVAGYHIYRVTGAGPIVATDLTSANEVTSSPNLVGSAIVNPASTQTATLGGLTEGTQYTFVVLAYDAAGNVAPLAGSGQKTVTPVATGVPPPPPPPPPPGPPPAGTFVSDRNEQIQETLNVTVLDEGGVTIAWDLPASDPARPTLGVQVWRCTSSDTSSCELIATLASTSPEFGLQSYTDVDGTADSRYIVTAYYGTTSADGYAANSADGANIPGFSQLTPVGGAEEGLFGLPIWLWIVIAIVLLLLVGAAIYLATRKKPAPEAEAAPADEWATTEEAAAAAPAAEAVAEPAKPVPETHHITCPKCSTEFNVTGVKPLVIQCPNCGVKGTFR